MGGPSVAWQIAQRGLDDANVRRQRKEHLSDEQRQSRENLLLNGYQSGAITAAQVKRGYDDLYAHEPEETRLHRLGRALSRKPAPAKGASPQADFQNIVGQFKSPEQLAAEKQQQQLGLYKSELGAQGEDAEQSQKKEDASFAAWKATLPREQQAAADEDYNRSKYGMKAPAPVAKGWKEIKAGEVVLGYRNQDTGQAITRGPDGKLPPDAPPDVQRMNETYNAVEKTKQDEKDKKEQEADARQLRTLKAISDRQGRSEEFQAIMRQYGEELGVYKTMDTQARNADERATLYQNLYSQPGNKSAADTALVTDYTGILAKGGRKTTAEIQLALKVGSFGLNMEQMYQKAASGELPDELRQLYLNYLKASAVSEREAADKAKPEIPQVGGGAASPSGGKGPAPKTSPGGDDELLKRLQQATGKPQ